MFWLTSLFMPSEKVVIKDMAILFVCAMCGVGINQWLFVVGLKKFLARRRLHHRYRSAHFRITVGSCRPQSPLRQKKSFGVFLGVSGGVLLVFSTAHTADGTNSPWRDTLMLLNQLMYSVYLAFSKPLPRRYSSVTMMKWMFLFSSLVFTPFCFPHVQHVSIFHRETFDMTQLCALLYLLFGATFVAFILSRWL